MAKIKNLKTDGLILLEPMTPNLRKKALLILDEIPDVKHFIIGEDEKEQIVVRYVPSQFSKDNFINEGNNYINNLRLLLIKKNVKTEVYAKLGLAYLNIKKINLAVVYLTVATELSKKEDGRFNFVDLIAKITGLIPEEDIKPSVKMKVSDFINGDTYFNIKDIKEIIKKIVMGVNINEIKEIYNLNEEEKNLVLLIIAREYYFLGDIKTGDKYLKMVEKASKTPKVKELYDVIIKSKNFYKYRMQNNFVPLILKIDL